MDTVRGHKGWWWLDADRIWRQSRCRVLAILRARRARRMEAEERIAEWTVRGGRWR